MTQSCSQTCVRNGPDAAIARRVLSWRRQDDVAAYPDRSGDQSDPTGRLVGCASESPDAPVSLRGGHAPCRHGTGWWGMTADSAFANSILKPSADNMKPTCKVAQHGLIGLTQSAVFRLRHSGTVLLLVCGFSAQRAENRTQRIKYHPK